MSWVDDSIEMGYALSHVKYQVKKITSTPTKQYEPVYPEFSMISAIGGPNSTQRAFIEETMSSPYSPGKNIHSTKRKGFSFK